MKRIARLSGEARNASTVLDSHTRLIALLRQYLPPSTATLFARPKAVEGQTVEWYSELGGQPQPFSNLPPQEAARARQQLDERLASLHGLADQLEPRGEEGRQQAALLRQAAEYPDTDTLYVLNGQPVITFWGGGKAPQQRHPPVTSPNPSRNHRQRWSRSRLMWSSQSPGQYPCRNQKPNRHLNQCQNQCPGQNPNQNPGRNLNRSPGLTRWRQ